MQRRGLQIIPWIVASGLTALSCSSDEKPSDNNAGGNVAGSTARGGVGGQTGTAGTSGRTGTGGRLGGTAGVVAGASGRAAGGSDATGGTSSELSDAGVPIDAELVPWGVAPSASSSRSYESWAPSIAAVGVRWVRGFDRTQVSTALATTNKSQLALSGFLLLDNPTGELTVPVERLSAWETYVKDSVTAAGKQIRYWEVWNEPPNFTADKSPASYAKVVVSAYDAAKSVDAAVQIGLATQSVNLNYLAQAIDAGARDHFDYITLHPYEVLDLASNMGWEAQFLNIVPTVRKLLADKNPAKKDVPILFTELGTPVGVEVTQELQADTLVKAYVLSLAQGVTRVHWFEPLDGDSGAFGLLDKYDSKRPAYTALATLIENLGAQPQYLGWAILDSSVSAFVFQGPKEPVMVAWTGPMTVHDVGFNAEVSVVRPGYGEPMKQNGCSFTTSPTLVAGIPASIVEQARGNKDKPFLWGADYSTSPAVSYTAPDMAPGLHPLGETNITMIDGVAARDISKATAQAFAVDPTFNSYTPIRIKVDVVTRRNGADPASFTLRYESTSGTKDAGGRYEIPGSDQWYTQSWTIDDPQFVGKWGYQILLDSESFANSKYSIRSVTVTKL